MRQLCVLVLVCVYWSKVSRMGAPVSFTLEAEDRCDIEEPDAM